MEEARYLPVWRCGLGDDGSGYRPVIVLTNFRHPRRSCWRQGVLAPGKVKLTDGKWNVVAAASTLFPIAVV